MLKRIALILGLAILLAGGYAGFAVGSEATTVADETVFEGGGDVGTTQTADPEAFICFDPQCACMEACHDQWVECANNCNTSGGGHNCFVACTQQLRFCQFDCDYWDDPWPN